MLQVEFVAWKRFGTRTGGWHFSGQAKGEGPLTRVVFLGDPVEDPSHSRGWVITTGFQHELEKEPSGVMGKNKKILEILPLKNLTYTNPDL